MRFIAIICAGLGVAFAAPAAAAPPAEKTESASDDAAAKKAAEKAKAVAIVQSSIDASRKSDFLAWLAHFSENAVVEINGMVARGRAQIHRNFRINEEAGVVDALGKVTNITVIDSGWKGEAIYVYQRESYSSGHVIDTYAEYTVRSGKIVKMVGSM